MSIHDEKRRSPRRHLNLKVVHKDPRTLKPAIDFARDLSMGGLFLWTKRRRVVGDTVELEFAASPDPRAPLQIRARGEVARVTPDGIALRFTHVDDLSVGILEKVLRGPPR